MVDKDEDVNELKWVVSTLEQQIHFLFLYFDWFRCHQNHVLFFFPPECNLFETFLIVVSSRLILPRKHAPKIFFPYWKEGWTWVSFCLLAGFQAQQLENLHWPFLFPERCSAQWSFPSSLGCSGPFLPRTFLELGPGLERPLPCDATHLPGTPACVP